MIVSAGVDPGKKASGWAYFFDDRLVACGLAKNPRTWIPSFRPPGGVHVCYGEMPIYRPEDSRSKPNDLIEVGVSLGAMTRAISADRTEYLYPVTWKGSTPKEIMTNWIIACLTEEEKKLLDGCGVSDTLIHNVADAIGILLVKTGRSNWR